MKKRAWVLCLVVLLSGWAGVSATAAPSTAGAGPGLSLSLKTGWNAVAFQVQRVTSLQGEQVAGMVFYDGAAYQTIEPGAITDGRSGYWVFCQAPTSLSYTGEEDGRGHLLELRSGWNLVSLATSQAVENLVTPEPLLAYEIQPDNQAVPVSTTQLRPGYCYWLFAAAPTRVTWGPQPANGPSIATEALAAGQVGVAYSRSLAASGGTPAYSWSALAGLPDGLTLSPEGKLSGQPSVSGDFQLTVQVTDSAHLTARRTIPVSIQPAPAPGAFRRRDRLVGDPRVSYFSTEFDPDWKYLIWTEYLNDGSDNGIAWHCEVDPDTGELIPWDGKGFRAFECTGWGRPSPGRDAQGAFYVGMNREGRLVLVRPQGATSGSVEVLPAPVDFTRRGIYATDLPQRPDSPGYVFWIKNASVAGGPGDTRNPWVELRYLSLLNPSVEVVLQHQNRPPYEGAFAPLDIVFPRGVRGTARVTSGVRDPQGKVQVVEFDLSQPAPSPVSVTSDPVTKSDAFAWTFGDQDILMSGTDSTQGATQVYTRPAGSRWFSLVETIRPQLATLAPPVFAQSNERIPFGGAPYTAFQVNSASAEFFDTTFQQPGEIWLATMLQSPQQQWRLSDDVEEAKFEDEPFVGRSQVWVFYSACPRGSNLRSATINLRRCDTPLTTVAP